MAITGYAVESMAYLTSGMVDRGEDCSLEAAMCKVCMLTTGAARRIIGGGGGGANVHICAFCLINFF